MANLKKTIERLRDFRDRDYVREGITYFDDNPKDRKELMTDAIELLERDGVGALIAFQDFVFRQNFDHKISSELLAHINMQINLFKQHTRGGGA